MAVNPIAEILLDHLFETHGITKPADIQWQDFDWTAGFYAVTKSQVPMPTVRNTYLFLQIMLLWWNINTGSLPRRLTHSQGCDG